MSNSLTSKEDINNIIDDTEKFILDISNDIKQYDESLDNTLQDPQNSLNILNYNSDGTLDGKLDGRLNYNSDGKLDSKLDKKNKDQPRFDKINKFNVAIASLKNKLKSADNIDELTFIASKIINLEQQIVIEKTNGYKELEKRKKEISDKIDKIRRELKRAEDDLQHIDNSLDLKVNGLKRSLQLRIDSLNEEYNVLSKEY